RWRLPHIPLATGEWVSLVRPAIDEITSFCHGCWSRRGPRRPLEQDLCRSHFKRQNAANLPRISRLADRISTSKQAGIHRFSSKNTTEKHPGRPVRIVQIGTDGIDFAPKTKPWQAKRNRKRA